MVVLLCVCEHPAEPGASNVTCSPPLSGCRARGWSLCPQRACGSTAVVRRRSAASGVVSACLLAWTALRTLSRGTRRLSRWCMVRGRCVPVEWCWLPAVCPSCLRFQSVPSSSVHTRRAVLPVAVVSRVLWSGRHKSGARRSTIARRSTASTGAVACSLTVSVLLNIACTPSPCCHHRRSARTPAPATISLCPHTSSHAIVAPATHMRARACGGPST